MDLLMFVEKIWSRAEAKKGGKRKEEEKGKENGDWDTWGNNII